jgi:uncharacterized protein YecE (DUF72 family)
LYPADLAATKWLAHYAARFDTVEVNNTFYRLPKPDTFAAWAASVPESFAFAIKASNYLTHYRRLREPQEPVERLLQHAAPLGARLAVVLLQLPPDMRADPARLDETLRAFGGRVRVAVEPRHASWWSDEVRAVLAAHDAALCLADRGSKPVTPLWNTAGWSYLRLHAGRAHPPSCYGRSALRSWTERLCDLLGPDPDGFVYFNNDGRGCAPRDAVVFAALAEGTGIATSHVPAISETPVR